MMCAAFWRSFALLSGPAAKHLGDQWASFVRTNTLWVTIGNVNAMVMGNTRSCWGSDDDSDIKSLSQSFVPTTLRL